MTAKQVIESGKAVLGIEFGSTRIKAILIDEDNKPIAQGSHEWENQLVDGMWTYSIDAVWNDKEKYIESMKNAIAEARNSAQATKSKIDYDAGAKKSIEAKIKAMEEKLSKMIFEKVEDNEQYKAKKAEIDALMQKVGVSTFELEKAEIGAKIAEIDRKLAQVESNNRIEERIGQLKEEQKVVGQNVLKQERMIALLEDFSKAKIALLEDSVNQYFSLIKWRFFETQINGGMSEVCRATVNGIDYDTLLNKSDKILCQVDLVKGFMKANNVSLPVMFDDAESIDSNRLPEIDGQMIVFKRDDCKLTVKEM